MEREERNTIILIGLGLICLTFIYPLSHLENWIFGLDNIKSVIFKQGGLFVLGTMSLLFGIISFTRLERFESYFYKRKVKKR